VTTILKAQQELERRDTRSTHPVEEWTEGNARPRWGVIGVVVLAVLGGASGVAFIMRGGAVRPSLSGERSAVEGRRSGEVGEQGSGGAEEQRSGEARERASRGAGEQRSGGAAEQRSGGAEQQRSGAAEEQGKGGAREQRSGGAEERGTVRQPQAAPQRPVAQVAPHQPLSIPPPPSSARDDAPQGLVGERRPATAARKAPLAPSMARGVPPPARQPQTAPPPQSAQEYAPVQGLRVQSIAYSRGASSSVTLQINDGSAVTLHEGESAGGVEVQLILPHAVYLRQGGNVFAVGTAR
jgi:hypothetical protein